MPNIGAGEERRLERVQNYHEATGFAALGQAGGKLPPGYRLLVRRIQPWSCRGVPSRDQTRSRLPHSRVR